MVFSSVVFLFYFLPAVLLIYFLAGKKFRNAVLLIASIIFYMWGEPRFVFILILSIVFNYISGMLIDSGTQEIKNIVLAVSIAFNLGVLFIYKYLDFTINIANNL